MERRGGMLDAFAKGVVTSIDAITQPELAFQRS
jgi:hypothetical protein